jgi:hypothetical protein
LINLDNLRIVDASEDINYKASTSFAKGCDCREFEKNIRIDLREHLKLNCDKNSNKKLIKIPKCYSCGTQMKEDIFKTSYRHHRIFTVITQEMPSVQTDRTTREINKVRQTIKNKQKNNNQSVSQFTTSYGKTHQEIQTTIQLYIDSNELDKHSTCLGRKLKIGDTLTGLFYLDSVLNYQLINERYVGEQTLNLISINTEANTKTNPMPTKLTKEKIQEGFDLGINYLKRSSQKSYDYSFFTRED